MVVNEDVVHAVEEVAAILEAESLRVQRQEGLEEFVQRLRQEVVAAQ